MSRGDTKRALGQFGSGIGALLRVRWIRWIAIVIALLLVLRAGLTQLLATAVDKAVEPYGLTCKWDRLSIGFLGVNGSVRNLRVLPLDDQTVEPLMDLEYAVFDVDTWALLGGKLRIARAEVDGFDIRLERDASGVWNFEEYVDLDALLAASSTPALESKIEEPEEEESTGRDLTLPLEVAALRFQAARLRVTDLYPEEPVELDLRMNAALSRLGDYERPARFGVSVTGGDVLYGASLDGILRTTPDSLEVQFKALLGALQPGQLQPYLDLIGVEAAAKTVQAEAEGRLALEVVGANREALALELTLHTVALRADGQEEFAIDELALRFDRIAEDVVSLEPVQARGTRGVIELREDGALVLGGFALLPHPVTLDPIATASEEPETATDPAEAASAAAAQDATAVTTAPAPESPLLRIGGLELADAELTLVDHGTSPAAGLSAICRSLDVGPLEFGPGAVDGIVPVKATLALQGVADEIVLDAELDLRGAERTLRFVVDATGVQLSALDPYLVGSGVERSLAGGSFRVTTELKTRLANDGVLHVELSVSDLGLSGDEQLFGIESLELRDAFYDAETGRLRLGALELNGLASQVELEGSGALSVLGMRFGVPVQLDASPAVDSGAAATPPKAHPLARWFDFPSLRAAVPPIEIGRIAMNRTDLQFLDSSTEPATRFAFDELSVELRDVVLGLPAGAEASPANLQARVALAGLVEELTLDGSVLVRPGDVDVDVRIEIAATGVNGAPLRPYLEPLGVSPQLLDGEAELTFEARVREVEGGVWRADSTVEALRLSDAGGIWVALERLELRELIAGGGRLDLTRLAIEGPFARVEREAGGALRIAGLRIAAPAAAAISAAPVAATKPKEDAAESSGSPFALPELPPVEVAELRVDRVRLLLQDEAFDPPLEFELNLDVLLERLNTLGEPIDVDLSASIPGLLSALEFDSRMQLVDEQLTVDGHFGARQFDPSSVAALLPPGLELETQNAELGGALAITARAAPEGGFAGRIAVSEVRWGEPESESWFELDSAVFEGQRLDPLAKLYEFGELQVRGARVRARRDESGAFEALGARLALNAPVESLAPTEAVDAPAEAPIDEVGMIQAAASAANESAVEEPPAPVAAPAPEAPARRLVAPPTIRFAKGASLELERFEFIDALLDPSRPTIAGGIRLDLGAGELINADPEDLPPTTWGIEGSLDGLVETWSLTGESSPFLPEPTHSLTFDARGVRLQGVVERVPALQGLMVGEVESGQLQAKLETVLFLQRSRPYELGFERAFGGLLRLSEAYLRDETDGAILLGVDEVLVHAKRILPDGSLVHLDSLEVDTPRMEVRRDAEGLHVGGLLIPLAAAETTPESTTTNEAATEDPAVVSQPVEPAATVATADPAGAGRAEDDDPPARTPELRIDQVFVGGLDVHIADSAVEPPLDVRFADFDLEVRSFTTRAFTKRKVISYRTFLAPGAEPGAPILFEDVATTGRLAFFPKLEGWGRTQVNALDLTQLSGYASEHGIEIREGLLDVTTRTDANGERVKVGLSLNFQDLSVKEKSGGPIERVLKLPMSIENALFLTRSPDGTHRISVGISLSPDGISVGELISQATGAIAVFFASALAGAPVRLLTSVAPMSGSKRDAEPIEVVEVPFRAGRTRFDEDARDELKRLARRLSDRDDLKAIVTYVAGDADAPEAEKLANPSQKECLELIAQLRRRRSELWRSIGEHKLDARALFAIGSPDAPATVGEMRVMERKLAEVEKSLDRVLSVLDSDSPRQRERRTSKVMRELGELRMQEAERALKAPLRGFQYDQLEFKPVRVRALEEGSPSLLRIELRLR